LENSINWNFINSNDKLIGLNYFKNEICIINFFFTKCPTVYPHLLKKINNIYKKKFGLIIQKKICLITITLDPINDSPIIVKKYKNYNFFNKIGWYMLTGTYYQINNFLIKKINSFFNNINYKLHLILLNKFGFMIGSFDVNLIGNSILFSSIDNFNINKLDI